MLIPKLLSTAKTEVESELPKPFSDPKVESELPKLLPEPKIDVKQGKVSEILPPKEEPEFDTTFEATGQVLKAKSFKEIIGTGNEFFKVYDREQNLLIEKYEGMKRSGLTVKEGLQELKSYLKSDRA